MFIHFLNTHNLSNAHQLQGAEIILRDAFGRLCCGAVEEPVLIHDLRVLVHQTEPAATHVELQRVNIQSSNEFPLLDFLYFSFLHLYCVRVVFPALWEIWITVS